MFTPILSMALVSNEEWAEIVKQRVEDMVVPVWLQGAAIFALVLSLVLLLCWIGSYIVRQTRARTELPSDIVVVCFVSLIPVLVNIVVIALLALGMLT
jgi:hypothetical protein